MITIAICDVRQECIADVYQKVNKIMQTSFYAFEIYTYLGGKDLLHAIKEGGMSFDIIIIEADLGVDNGIDLIEMIKKRFYSSYVIFMSEKDDFCKQAFRVQPYHFLDKPLEYRKLKEVLHALIKTMVVFPPVLDFFYKYGYYRIYLENIVYIECCQRKLVVHMQDERIYEFYNNLCDVEEQIARSSQQFLRVHRSFLVNMCYIKVIQPGRVILHNGEMIPLSAQKCRRILATFVKHQLG